MRILCFGDSNTYGYDPRSFFGDRYAPEDRWVDLLAKHTGHKLINAGSNGRQIPRSVHSLPSLTESDMLLVMLGTNDLLQGNPSEVVADRMEHFLNNIQLERSRLILIAPPSMQLGAWVPEQHLIDGSRELRVHYGAMAGRLGIRYGAWEMPVAFDGVHLTQEGHRILGSRLSEFIKSEVRDEQHQ